MTELPLDPPIAPNKVVFRLSNPADALDYFDFRVNPFSMGSFESAWAYQGTRSYVTGLPLVTRKLNLTTATLEGNVYNKEQYDSLVHWSHRNIPLYLSDHFKRTWEVIVTGVDLKPRKSVKDRPWRFSYTMSVTVFGSVTP